MLSELFKTVLILSISGFFATAVLLILKPVTTKSFSARLHYLIWIVVMLSMIFPVYKLIPSKNAQQVINASQNKITGTAALQNYDNTTDETIHPNGEEYGIKASSKSRICLMDLAAYIWLCGMLIYSFVITTAYTAYLFKKRKNSVCINECTALYEAEKKLKIRRRIKIRMSPDVHSPLLVGLILPTIYLPCREIPQENMYMIFLHELTHYKKKDLFIKWLSLFVSIVHWFNPASYLLCVNISEACELSCDMSVTKNMSLEEQKIYMNTILNLAK